MGQVKALFETNILIDYLNGIPEARPEIKRHGLPLISLVIWMEVLAVARVEEDPAVRRFLSRFQYTGLDQAFAERSIVLRKRHRIKLPDAIIWATALDESVLRVTRNTRDFPSGEPAVRIPYRCFQQYSTRIDPKYAAARTA